MSSAIKQLEDDINSIKRDMDLIVKAWTSTFGATAQEVRAEPRLQVSILDRDRLMMPKIPKSPEALMFERMLENPYYPQSQTYNPTVGVGSVTVLGRGSISELLI